MSTFAKSTFNASTYSASRPTYPPQLFQYIFSFHRRGTESHKPQWERAVDLGCGTGQATEHLRSFRQVIGIDPSQRMLEKARAEVGSAGIGPSFTFVQGSAEDLHKVLPEDESVDLLVAGKGLILNRPCDNKTHHEPYRISTQAQSAHWFDWSKVWPETNRLLRPGGTAAFWVYAEFRLPQFPSLGPRITDYAQGSDPQRSVGQYFQRPGRTILERHLIDVPEPSSILKDSSLQNLHRVYFTGDDIPSFIPANPTTTKPVLMRKDMRWRDLLGYFRTWSALHNYHEKYPEDMGREEDPRFLERDLADSSEPGDIDEMRKGDVAIRFWKDLRQGALQRTPDAHVGVEDKVTVEWPLALLLTKKR